MSAEESTGDQTPIKKRCKRGRGLVDFHRKNKEAAEAAHASIAEAANVANATITIAVLPTPPDLHRDAYIAELEQQNREMRIKLDAFDALQEEKNMERVALLAENVRLRKLVVVETPEPFARTTQDDRNPKSFTQGSGSSDVQGSAKKERTNYFGQRKYTLDKIYQNIAYFFSLCFANFGIPLGWTIGGVDIISPRGELFRIDAFHDSINPGVLSFKPGLSPISTRTLNASGFVESPASTSSENICKAVRGTRPEFFSASMPLSEMPEDQRLKMISWIASAAAWKVSKMVSDLCYYALCRWDLHVPPIWRVKEYLEILDRENAVRFGIKTTTVRNAERLDIGYTRGVELTVLWFLNSLCTVSLVATGETPLEVMLRLAADGRQVFGNGNTGSFYQSICCLKFMPPFGPQGSSPNDEVVLGVHDGKEGYAPVQTYFLPIFKEIESLQGKVFVLNNGSHVKLHFVVCSDYKYLLEIMGLQQANHHKGWCAWCTATKAEINKVDNLCTKGDTDCKCGFPKQDTPKVAKKKQTSKNKVEMAADRTPKCVMSRTRDKSEFDAIPKSTQLERGWKDRPLLFNVDVLPDTLHLIMRITLLFYHLVMDSAVALGRTKAAEAEMRRIGMSNWHFSDGGDPSDASTAKSAATSAAGKRVSVPSLTGDPARKFLAEFNLSVVYDGPPGVLPYTLPTTESLSSRGSSPLDNMNILFHMLASLVNTLETTCREDYGAVDGPTFKKRVTAFLCFYRFLLKPGQLITPYMHVLGLHIPDLRAIYEYLHNLNMEGVECKNMICNTLFRDGSPQTGGKGAELSGFSKHVICYAMRLDVMRVNPAVANVLTTRPWNRRSDSAADSDDPFGNVAALAAWSEDNKKASPDWVWDLALADLISLTPTLDFQDCITQMQSVKGSAATSGEVKRKEAAARHAEVEREEAEEIENDSLAKETALERKDAKAAQEEKGEEEKEVLQPFDANIHWVSQHFRAKEEKRNPSATIPQSQCRPDQQQPRQPRTQSRFFGQKGVKSNQTGFCAHSVKK